MKLFGRAKGISEDNNYKKKVLFVCVENVGRSQMAEGFFLRYSPKNYEPLSAGTSITAFIFRERFVNN